MGKIVFVFPGQGTQFVGMGADLYRSSSLAKKLFDLARDTLGFNLTEIMFNGPEEKLRQTEIAQLAIFLHSYVSYQLLGYQPDMAVGHSLGMYTALAAAGVFSFADALMLVNARGKAMQFASYQYQGKMAAIIGLSADKVGEICTYVIKKNYYVQIANYNCPGQVVISGDAPAITEAMDSAKRAGARLTKEIEVSGAFHSLLMWPAYEGLSQALGLMKFSEPQFRVYSDTDATVLNAKSMRLVLLRQLVTPVRWTDVVCRMVADGADEFVEVGPGKVLRGLIKRIDESVKVYGVENLLEVKNNGISNS